MEIIRVALLLNYAFMPALALCCHSVSQAFFIISPSSNEYDLMACLLVSLEILQLEAVIPAHLKQGISPADGQLVSGILHVSTLLILPDLSLQAANLGHLSSPLPVAHEL